MQDKYYGEVIIHHLRGNARKKNLEGDKKWYNIRDLLSKDLFTFVAA